jgi:hypothetical protein
MKGIDTMGKAEAAKENWEGLTFGNGWVIQKKLNCAEYRAIYIEQTGDTSKQIKNAHYLCYNENCGIATYIERTVIKRTMDANRDCLSKCKGCNGDRENCHYSVQCRQFNLSKVPDRTPKASVGDIIGNWKVLKIIPSGNNAGHQVHVIAECALCGKQREITMDGLISRSAPCDCYRSHSSGEMLVKTYLDKCNYPYITEYIFDNLVGLGSGSLRYDFALLSADNKVIGLIEFDGEQHYQEAGSYFNETGKVQIHDKIKDQFAEKYNIPLLRIPYFEAANVDTLIAAFLLELN